MDNFFDSDLNPFSCNDSTDDSFNSPVHLNDANNQDYFVLPTEEIQFDDFETLADLDEINFHNSPDLMFFDSMDQAEENMDIFDLCDIGTPLESFNENTITVDINNPDRCPDKATSQRRAPEESAPPEKITMDNVMVLASMPYRSIMNKMRGKVSRVYTTAERRQKIERFKNKKKLFNRRDDTRRYKSRSLVANSRKRIGGRFVGVN